MNNYKEQNAFFDNTTNIECNHTTNNELEGLIEVNNSGFVCKHVVEPAA